MAVHRPSKILPLYLLWVEKCTSDGCPAEVDVQQDGEKGSFRAYCIALHVEALGRAFCFKTTTRETQQLDTENSHQLNGLFSTSHISVLSFYIRQSSNFLTFHPRREVCLARNLLFISLHSTLYFTYKVISIRGPPCLVSTYFTSQITVHLRPTPYSHHHLNVKTLLSSIAGLPIG